MPEATPIRCVVAGENHAFCCSGCAAAATWIGEAALGDYYRLRSASAGRVGTEPPDPTTTPFAHVSRNSGTLTGVTSIFKPDVYRLPLETEAVPTNVGMNQRL